MDRFALKKRKKGPKSDNVATNSANPHVVWTPQAEATNDRFSASSWLAAEPLPRQNRGSQDPGTGADSSYEAGSHNTAAFARI